MYAIRMGLLQMARVFLVAMLAAWAAILTSLYLVGKGTVHKLEELEEQGAEEQGTEDEPNAHKRAA